MLKPNLPVVFLLSQSVMTFEPPACVLQPGLRVFLDIFFPLKVSLRLDKLGLIAVQYSLFAYARASCSVLRLLVQNDGILGGLFGTYTHTVEQLTVQGEATVGQLREKLRGMACKSSR